jgi:hypothetical protein
MSRPMNGKTVEIRLIIFRARTLQILTQISYYTLADFSNARSRVDGLHITPPQPRTGERRGRLMARVAKEDGHGEGPEPEKSGSSRGGA